MTFTPILTYQYQYPKNGNTDSYDNRYRYSKVPYIARQPTQCSSNVVKTRLILFFRSDVRRTNTGNLDLNCFVIVLNLFLLRHLLVLFRKGNLALQTAIYIWDPTNHLNYFRYHTLSRYPNPS